MNLHFYLTYYVLTRKALGMRRSRRTRKWKTKERHHRKLHFPNPAVQPVPLPACEQVGHHPSAKHQLEPVSYTLRRTGHHLGLAQVAVHEAPKISELVYAVRERLVGRWFVLENCKSIHIYPIQDCLASVYKWF